MDIWEKMELTFEKLEDVDYYKDEQILENWYMSPFVCPVCKCSIIKLVQEHVCVPCTINERVHFMANSLYACLKCEKFFAPIGGYDLTADFIVSKDIPKN